uniref:Reverse transcriptase domain-containing protein n=1 Tax=Fundulus heteroclitus TaxID=8078 RepID=A0A3Q2R358_FUNHE
VNADNNCTSALLLLDLSAAFDNVDICILLDRLENFIGTSAERHGVPQGSVLDPLLFSLYLLLLGLVLCSFNVTFHCHADDLQLYVPLTTGNRVDLSKIETCLCEISGWLSNNFLLLNANKTDLNDCLILLFCILNIADDVAGWHMLM